MSSAGSPFSSNASEIEATLRDRIYSEPYIIIGTNAYRRAMCGIDIDDIMTRIETTHTREEFIRLGGFKI